MISTYLQNELNKHPNHEPQDIYKFIYQGVFAGGHIITNKEAHLAWLKKEMNEVRDRIYQGVEKISDLYARINLDGLIKTSIDMNTLEKMILVSAENNKESMVEFEQGLNIWKTLEKDARITDFITEMNAQNYPLVHHSEIYRQMYQPAYRIIDQRYAFYLDLFMKIDEVLKTKKRVVIAIDGDAGSGKSELAKLLQTIYVSSLIHMDDFFLQDHQRTDERSREVGGNIDYERFIEEVVKPIKKGVSFSYRPFNCQTHLFDAYQEVKNLSVTIVEGSYSLHPIFGLYHDVSVYLKVSHEEQLSRIKSRNHMSLYSRFVNEWIPKEKAYFKSFDIEKSAQFKFDTTSATIL